MDGLTSLKGVGNATLAKLNALGIFDYDGLAAFLPRDYMDFDSATPLEAAEDGVFVLCELTVQSVSKPFRKGGLSVFRAGGISDAGTRVKLVWYNSPYVSQHINQGCRVRCSGKLKKGVSAELINPVYELCAGEIKLKGIRPIYPTRNIVGQAVLHKAIADMLTKYSHCGIIAKEDERRYGLMSLAEAVSAAHKPQSIAQAETGRERIALEELVKRIAAFRLARESSRRVNYYLAPQGAIDTAEAALPFALTASQKTAVSEIIAKLKSDKPLNSMLTGDVGSGKTAVAMLVSYFAIRSGYQAALMAPTEILAAQHYTVFAKLLAPLGVRVVLLTGSVDAKEKARARAALLSGEADIAIGTQALFSRGAEFCRLGLAIIDEQHRFGVAQRTALVDKGEAVDTLTLSATPIPRSLRLTMFGDIDVVSIDRRHPADNITTAVVPPQKRDAMLDYIADECEKGAKAFVVAPRIEEDGAEAAEELFAELNKKYGKRIKIGLLHGKIKAAAKQEAIDGFSKGNTRILVSTTVIEVGVDVPDASIMAVFDAERFGLATLHQLRGRIGRSGQKAYCFLYTGKNPGEQARLTVLTKETDGIAVAEKDYELRGAGDFLGESQSGRGLAGIGLPISLVTLAKRLADGLDTEKYKDLLTSYIARFGLERITLS